MSGRTSVIFGAGALVLAVLLFLWKGSDEEEAESVARGPVDGSEESSGPSRSSDGDEDEPLKRERRRGPEPQEVDRSVIEKFGSRSYYQTPILTRFFKPMGSRLSMS